MRKIVPLCLLLLLSFCCKKESRYPRITVPEQQNVIEVNTKAMLHTSSENNGNFFVLNFNCDTIIPKKHAPSRESDFVVFKWDTVLPRYDFKVFIDTSYTIATKGHEYKNFDFWQKGDIDFSKVFALWDDYVVCYPLLIYNNSDTQAYGKVIKMIYEAKDSDGKWKPIEFFADTPSCLVDSHFYKFLPKQYTALSVIKYHGDFRTKLRVKVRIGKFNYYSNEIEGTINKTQFDKAMPLKVLPYFRQFSNALPISEERLNYSFLKEIR